MTQLHKRFTDGQIRFLFKRYCEGLMPRIEIEEIIGISKTGFFALVKAYHLSPETFSIAYLRTGEFTQLIWFLRDNRPISFPYHVPTRRS